MLSINFPKIEKKTFNDLEMSLVEEKIKINIRGKSKDFFTKIGKINDVIFPILVKNSFLFPLILILIFSSTRDISKSLNVFFSIVGKFILSI